MAQKDYLPDFLKDFHDQKDFFKCLADFYKDNESYKNLPNAWISNHIFAIDFFLYFCAQHGYKLSKNKKYKIAEISETIAFFKNEQSRQFSELLKSSLIQDQSTK